MKDLQTAIILLKPKCSTEEEVEKYVNLETRDDEKIMIEERRKMVGLKMVKI